MAWEGRRAIPEGDLGRRWSSHAHRDTHEASACRAGAATGRGGRAHLVGRPRADDHEGDRWAVREQFAKLEVGDELELQTGPVTAIVPDLKAWCRATGHEFVDVRRDAESWRTRLRKGAPRRNEHRVALVVSSDGLIELLSPLGFALAAALGGAQVAVYLQGPAVHVLAPGFRPRLHGPARQFSRFARAASDKVGHVAPTQKLRQLQALGGVLYACGPSLKHFRVDPDRLAFDGVVVCEYLTFMEVMQQADVGVLCLTALAREHDRTRWAT